MEEITLKDRVFKNFLRVKELYEPTTATSLRTTIDLAKGRADYETLLIQASALIKKAGNEEKELAALELYQSVLELMQHCWEYTPTPEQDRRLLNPSELERRIAKLETLPEAGNVDYSDLHPREDLVPRQ